MSKLEIEIVKQATPEQMDLFEYEQGPKIDLEHLCKETGTVWVSYREYLPGQEDIPEKDRKYAPAYLLHERGEETGLKFNRKRDLAEAVMSFAVYRLAFPRARLTLWASGRGYAFRTTMSEKEIKAMEARRVAMAAMKEAAAVGEHEKLKAGVSKIKATDV